MFDMAPMGPHWWTIGLVVTVLLGVTCLASLAHLQPRASVPTHRPSSSCVTISRTARSTTRTTCDGDQPWETDERVQESFSRWAWLVGISMTHDVCRVVRPYGCAFTNGPPLAFFRGQLSRRVRWPVVGSAVRRTGR